MPQSSIVAAKQKFTNVARQTKKKMTETLKIFSSITVDGRKYSKSFCSHTVGQALRFFRYNNNLCKTLILGFSSLCAKGMQATLSIPWIQNWLGKFCLRSGLMCSGVILQVGLVFLSLHRKRVWKMIIIFFSGCKISSVFLIVWRCRRLNEVV